MRKYFITRKSAVTTVYFKAVNTSTYEVSDYQIQLDGAFANNEEAMKAVNKNWEDEIIKPIAVTGTYTTIKTLAMTAQQWFENAECIEEVEVSAEEAAQFGKRAKRSEASDNQ